MLDFTAFKQLDIWRTLMQQGRQTGRDRLGPTAIYTDVVRESALTTNKVLKNTYLLLSATLIFSAIMAAVSVAINMPHPGLLISLGGMFGLLYLTHKFKNSAMGLVFVFAFTGFLGLLLGPMLNIYLESVPNGGQLILTALGATGLIFLSLSAYVLTTGKDMSFMGGFLMIGLFGLVGVVILGFFVNLSAFQMAISAGFVLLMSGFILFDTSRIIHGGETNYITATISLYLNIYIMFQHLLMLFGMGGDD
jgi:modulator of FtsH protease